MLLGAEFDVEKFYKAFCIKIYYLGTAYRDLCASGPMLISCRTVGRHKGLVQWTKWFEEVWPFFQGQAFKNPGFIWQAEQVKKQKQLEMRFI